MSIYWNGEALNRDHRMPSILAIGDSWFWYPFPGGSLASYLGPIVDSKGHAILAKGNNGAEAFQYVDGKYRKEIIHTLKFYGSGLSAVFISGGGNDFAGFNDMRPLLGLDCTNATTAAECFMKDDGGLDDFLERMELYYRTLIGRIYTYTSLDCFIILHNYDYAIPNGRGVFGKTGWLKPALVDAGVPVHLQQDCVHYLIDEFHKMLERVCAMDKAHLLIVDSRGTLGPDDWANELHPKGEGFRKIAEERWTPVLQAANLA